jgi:hypothetical protein
MFRISLFILAGDTHLETGGPARQLMCHEPCMQVKNKSNICTVLYLYKVPGQRTPDIFLILSGLDVSGWFELVGWYTILTATNPPCQRLFSFLSSTHTHLTYAVDVSLHGTNFLNKKVPNYKVPED